MKIFYLLAVIFCITLQACKNDDKPTDTPAGTTPYKLVVPTGMPSMAIPADNPLTVEGIALGRKLFYDPILSANNSQSCASCHKQSSAFVDSNFQFSIGIDNIAGTRNAMPIFNLGWERNFFWDGGAATLESQVIGPIQNPVEMHETLENVLKKLNSHQEYPALFKKAFGTDSITIPKLMKAIAQFERTIISANSKYDRYKRGELQLSPSELNGMQIYVNQSKGDCNHCHVLGSTFTDFDFRNTGLDSIPVDKGRGNITLNPTDDGKFKTPTLRNIELTSPYMHDGRFKTLEECINHYNIGFKYSDNIDPNLAALPKNRMSPTEIADLVAFLKTLTDYSLITNPAYSKP